MNHIRKVIAVDAEMDISVDTNTEGIHPKVVVPLVSAGQSRKTLKDLSLTGRNAGSRSMTFPGTQRALVYEY